MPRKSSRAANGTGTIRQRSDGRWECRITIGKNPATGKPLRKSFYAPTQGELVKLMKQVQADLDSGTYQEPSKMTVGKWMDIWLVEYLGNIKQHTRASYSGHTKNQIKPDLGFIPLQKLSPHHVQTFYNDLQKTLSPKSIKNIHGVLHGAMAQAVKLGYIKQNPTEICTLPRVVKKEVKVIPDDKVGEFLQVISGHQFETVYYVDLFTGMRQGEILGLTWDSVDFKNGTILISKQLIK